MKTTNPCIAVFGTGPDGVRCATCSHLQARQYANRYYKCDLRRISASTATDHRVRWDACGKYEGVTA